MVISLPPELYQLIFRYVAPQMHRNIRSDFVPFDESYKNVITVPNETWAVLRNRHSVASVCQEWRSVALEILVEDLFIFNATQAAAILQLFLNQPSLNEHVRTVRFHFLSSQSQSNWPDSSLVPTLLDRISLRLTNIFMVHCPLTPGDNPSLWNTFVFPSTAFPMLRNIHWHIQRGHVESSYINAALDQVASRAPALENLNLTPIICDGLFRTNSKVSARPAVLLPSLRSLQIGGGMTVDTSMLRPDDLPNLSHVSIHQRAIFLHPTGPAHQQLLEFIGPQLTSLELIGSPTLLSLGSVLTYLPYLQEVALLIDKSNFFPSGNPVHANIRRIRLHSHWEPYSDCNIAVQPERTTKVGQQLQVLRTLGMPRLEAIIATGNWIQYMSRETWPVFQDSVPFLNELGERI
ncbi:hypothetical protein DL96DRAFT_1702530 [Flagelloscypha sp. PMI_526]|nr:hypothetical protein DL96DRAFT_1702530 [Flagelloscypha sp. PMI_526]